MFTDPACVYALHKSCTCATFNFQLSKPDEKASQIVNTITTNIEQMCPSGKCGLTAKDFTESVFQCFAQNAHEVTFRTRLHETSQASTMEIVNAMTQWVAAGATMTVDGVVMKVDQTCKIDIEILSEPECKPSGPSSATNNGIVLESFVSVVTILVS